MTSEIAWLLLALAGFAGAVATFVDATQRYARRFGRGDERS